MARRQQKKSFIAAVDRLVAAPLEWVVGRPKGRKADTGSQVDQALGEAVSWIGLDARARRSKRHR